MSKHEHLTAIDFSHLWHPFTQSTVWLADRPVIIERGEGVELIDIEGGRYLDGVSSLWCNVHGHSHPEIIAAISEQAKNLGHSTLLGLSHRPVLELTELLVSFLPKHLSRFFYADSGSTAVEAALRMALEYWQRGSGSDLKRTKVGSLFEGYHGDTLGAVSIGYVDIFHRSLRNIITPALRIKPPHLFRYEEQLSEEDATSAALNLATIFFNEHGTELATFFIEPLMQGAAGMWAHSPRFLEGIAKLCQEYGVLLVVDEVATGFGKTGSMFAFEQTQIEPDIVIVGKGLSGGYLPISAAITTEKIFSRFSAPPEEFKTFFYGTTFAGNPLGCAASIANLKLFNSQPLLETVNSRITHLHSELDSKISPLDPVFEIRRCGLMVGIELTSKRRTWEPFPTAHQVGGKIVKAAREQGAVIRPLGNTLVLMPALAMNEEQISRLVSITQSAIIAGTKD